MLSCRARSWACTSSRARRSASMSARRVWRISGIIGASSSRRKCSAISKTVIRFRAKTISQVCAGLKSAAHFWRQSSNDIDVLLVPCVQGEAPKGLASTGDPSFQAIWTALHTPSLTLPTHRGPNNLPVGIQLVGQRYDDDRLLACARLDLGEDRHARTGRREQECTKRPARWGPHHQVSFLHRRRVVQ